MIKHNFLTLLLFVFTLSPSLATDLSDDEIARADYKKLIQQLTPLEGSTPAQWRITWTGDSSTTATVSWSTAVAGKKHTLHYGTEAFGQEVAKYQHHVDCQKNGAYSITAEEAQDTKTAFYHHCKIENLKPKTKYYFVLESDGELSRQFYFITAPERGEAKLICGGDSRSGIVDRCRMNLRMAKLLKTQPDIYALCHGGDYIATGRSWRQWRLWLSQNELTTLSDGRVLPIIPTKGNHDGGPLFFEVFNLESSVKGERAYWDTAQFTKPVQIVTLDTNYTAKGPQEKWLQTQLEELRPKTTFLLTNYHRPLYPAVKKPAKQTAVFVPLFEKYNIDLAIESDGHCIKRTAPIRDGKVDPSGIIYIGEGGLGVSQRQPKKDLWYLTDGYVGRGHHVFLLSFTQESLNVETITMEGKVIDSFTVKPRK